MLRAPAVRVPAGPHARDERGSELAASHESYDERAEPKALVHVKRQYRHGDADDQERDEDRSHDRQQCGDRGLRCAWHGHFHVEQGTNPDPID